MNTSAARKAAFVSACKDAVELGNRMARKSEDADTSVIADGILAGAIQYWLFSRAPCEDASCDGCQPFHTSAGRLHALLEFTKEMAAESEYFHLPTDTNVGHA